MDFIYSTWNHLYHISLYLKMDIEITRYVFHLQIEQYNTYSLTCDLMSRNVKLLYRAVIYALHWENYISISFHIEWDMIVVTVFLSIFSILKWNSIWFKIERKTVTMIISHSIWKELEVLFSQCSSGLRDFNRSSLLLQKNNNQNSFYIG